MGKKTFVKIYSHVLIWISKFWSTLTAFYCGEHFKIHFVYFRFGNAFASHIYSHHRSMCAWEQSAREIIDFGRFVCVRLVFLWWFVSLARYRTCRYSSGLVCFEKTQTQIESQIKAQTLKFSVYVSFSRCHRFICNSRLNFKIRIYT